LNNSGVRRTRTARKTARTERVEPTARVEHEREVLVYRLYLDSAAHFCSNLTRKEYVSWFDLMAAITICSLSVEAIANTLGSLVVPNFKDFESSSPFAKVRIISEKLGVPFDRSRWPFNEISKLIKTRNRLAHPDTKPLRYVSPEMSISDAQKYLATAGDLLTEVEGALTPDYARTALKAVTDLVRLLESKIDRKLLREGSRRSLVFSDE
jgi:hypothetical protein